MNLHYLSGSTVPSSKANAVHVMKMCQEFSRNGHSVVLFAYTAEGEADVYEHYGVERSFQIRALPGSRIPGIRRVKRTYGVRRLAKAHSLPDLFYGRDLFSLLGIRSLGVPMVFEAHTAPRGRLETQLIGRLLSDERFLRLIVISEALADEFRSLYPKLTKDRVLVAHDGAEETLSAPPPEAEAWPGRRGTLQLGFVGSLLPGKGAEVVAQLAGRLPEHDFHIVGGDASQVQRLRDTYREPNLTLHGHVQHARVPGILARIDIALLPCQRNVVVESGVNISPWMSPLKLFEYMAADVSIVSSDLPVIKEVLTDQLNAILVPPDSLDDWVGAIETLAKNDVLRKTLAHNAREEFVARYTWNKRAERVLAGIG